MRFLVTGASGFVGGHLCALLTRSGHEVATLSRDGVIDDPIDICDALEVRSAVAACRPEGIFHLAAIAYVPEAEGDAARAHRVNVDGTRNLLDAAAVVGARVLFVSSGAVYGDGADTALPFREDSPLAPLGVYARTKAEAEAECVARAEQQAIVRVRPFNHTGPGQAASYVCSGFAKQIVEIELGLRAPIVQVGDLDAERDFCDVRDIVRAYALALESGEAGAVYNVCSGVPTPIRDILATLVEIASVRVEVRQDRERLRDCEPSRLWGSNTKISAGLGWRPEILLRRTLTDMMGWWRARLAGDLRTGGNR
jgi:GDP-4-dehydro-6-deoxy-D-mannose reductase